MKKKREKQILAALMAVCLSFACFVMQMSETTMVNAEEIQPEQQGETMEPETEIYPRTAGWITVTVTKSGNADGDVKYALKRDSTLKKPIDQGGNSLEADGGKKYNTTVYASGSQYTISYTNENGSDSSDLTNLYLFISPNSNSKVKVNGVEQSSGAGAIVVEVTGDATIEFTEDNTTPPAPGPMHADHYVDIIYFAKDGTRKFETNVKVTTGYGSAAACIADNKNILTYTDLDVTKGIYLLDVGDTSGATGRSIPAALAGLNGSSSDQAVINALTSDQKTAIKWVNLGKTVNDATVALIADISGTFGGQVLLIKADTTIYAGSYDAGIYPAMFGSVLSGYFDLTNATSAGSAVKVNTCYLNGTIGFTNCQLSTQNVAKVELADPNVPAKAVEITGLTAKFKSNYYDTVTFRLTFADGQQRYVKFVREGFTVKSIVKGSAMDKGYIMHGDFIPIGSDGQPDYSSLSRYTWSGSDSRKVILCFCYDKGSSVNDYQVVANYVYANGKTETKIIPTALGSVADTAMDGSNAVVAYTADYEIWSGSDPASLSSISVTVTKKGAISMTSSYGGTTFGSGRGYMWKASDAAGFLN